MTDRRFFAANARVAHADLEGSATAPRYTEGTTLRCVVPVADLCQAPGGARDKQMLRGQAFRVLEVHGGWAFGFDEVDGYVGYLPEAALGQAGAPTHRVSVRATHVYSGPDIKARERLSLSFLSGLRVTGEAGEFAAIEGGGYVPRVHLQPVERKTQDPAGVAELFLGTPYLWGGNSAFGIDCSGLVQLAFEAAGVRCPRDSDLQERAPAQDLAPGKALARGDLVFWAGHVGIMLDSETLLHANAHHMRVVAEPLAGAAARIAAQGGGPVTARRRL